MLVNDVDKLKKADSELLIAYLKEPCETTVLALEGQKVAKTPDFIRLFRRLGVKR